MTHDASPPPPVAALPRRRWWRLSLRRAMILIVVMAGPIGWEANRVSRMRRAVAVLERPVAGEQRPADSFLPPLTEAELAPSNRTQIRYDQTWRNGELQDLSRFDWLPGWVRKGAGEDHFRRVTGVRIDRRPTPEDWAALATLGTVVDLDLTSYSMTDGITDADLGPLDQLTGLQGLDLNGSQVTDAVLGSIGRLRSLRRLDLYGTNVTAEGLRMIVDLTQLEELHLHGQAGTDVGLAHLVGLTRLRSLTILGEADVSDDALTHLGKMVDLERLNFSTSRVTAAGLARLAALPKLKELEIARYYPIADSDSADTPDAAMRPGKPFWETPEGAQELGGLAHLETLVLIMSVGDDCLRAIGRLTKLCDLSVSGLAITDQKVAALANLKQLEKLTLFAPRMTDDGLRSLGQLARLRTLSVPSSTGITDAGLAHLRSLARLESLTLPAQVTPEGIEVLQTMLPKRIAIDTISLPPPPTPASPSGNP